MVPLRDRIGVRGGVGRMGMGLDAKHIHRHKDAARTKDFGDDSQDDYTEDCKGVGDGGCETSECVNECWK